MANGTLVDVSAQVPPGSRRAEVLDLLRRAEQPLSVAAVAKDTGLHVNTARFHLDGLVEDGLAVRTAEARDVPGRPRILYSAEGPAVGPRSYRLLAEMLTGLVASLKNRDTVALEVGRSWGRHLVERSAPSERVDAREAVARLNRVLDAVGFQPETRKTKQGHDVLLHHCPFREVAEEHTDVVCAIHLGLMQGALSEVRAPVEAASLEPFVTPSLCRARLRPDQARAS
jgi:predicted ArsR family transcriptional regulator